ncbi:MAG: SEC-C domain-containing protein [Deltaproteobacteria bacterium]|nr:SEC-C domain-containing protein [Deltaproteobacteria bacterium]
MSRVGRNDPCPCGSGKKYKKCCLAKERDAAREAKAEGEATMRSFEWLADNFHGAMDEAREEQFYAALEDEARSDIPQLPVYLLETLERNTYEFFLAEGTLEVDGEQRTTQELLLGAGGPQMEPAERRRMEELFSRPLGLYRVEESRRGEGTWLQDTLGREKPERLWVAEVEGAEEFPQGLLLATRVVPGGGVPGDPGRFDGGLMPFTPSCHEALCQELLEKLGNVSDPAEARAVTGRTIVDAWMRQLAVMGRSTEDPEPRQALPQIPRQEIWDLEATLERWSYRDWADQPIEELGGNTPRQTVHTKRGRPAVIALLEAYQEMAQAAAEEDGRKPLSFDFLWQSVGLTPPSPAG